MATSREANLRLQAQTIIATVIGGASVTAGSWLSNVVTLTIGAHAVLIGQTIVVSGIVPSAYNGTYVVTAVNTTQVGYALMPTPGAYVSGGKVTAQVQCGLENVGAGVDFFGNLNAATSATAGAAAIVLPAENGPWNGQTRHYQIIVPINLYYGAVNNTSVDFTAFEDSWTAICNALATTALWTTGESDEMTIAPITPRTDLPGMAFMYELRLIFWGGRGTQ